MNPKVIYYDNFANTYCLTTDVIAPPERYLPTYRGTDDKIYIETYERCGIRLNISYSKEDRKFNLVNRIRYSVAEKNNFNINSATLIKWVIPCDLYDKYVEDYCLETKMEESENESSVFVNSQSDTSY